MNNKLTKIVSIVVMIILFIILGTYVFADSGIDVNQLTGTAPKSAGEIKEFGNKIIGVLQAIAIVSSVIVLIVLGIKYMVGSIEEKAEYKKNMMPYIIGAVLVFSAATISAIVMGFFTPNG